MQKRYFSDVDVLCADDSFSVSMDYIFSKLRKCFTFTFSRRFKDEPDLNGFYTLTDNNTTAISLMDSVRDKASYQFVFGEEDFSKVTIPVTYEFIINKNSGSWIGVGAALESIIKQNRPRWGFTQKDHGAYLIGHNKWVGAHKQDINNQTIAFTFIEGDSIRVTYIPSTRDLVFVKNPTQEDSTTYTIKDILPEAKPCVIMLYRDCSVTIK
jgi:hypothetical protein